MVNAFLHSLHMSVERGECHKFFDWQKYCWDHIDEEKDRESNEIISDIINVQDASSQKWAERIRRRGNVFFMVIQAWVRHIRTILYVEKAIGWSDIPGYTEILSALFEELQNRNINFYPDALVEAVKSFLANPKLLNPVIRITFSKTSAYDSLAVLKTMKMTQKFFLKLCQKHMLIPSDFDWAFFMRGITKLLELDHSTSTAKVIWLLYQILHTIPKRERD